MADPRIFKTAAAVQQAETVPDLLRLLTHTVPEEDLPTYGELSPGLPDMAIFGNLRDGLERVSSDPTARADLAYTAIMFAGALTKIVRAQEVRIEALENASAGRSGAGTKK